MEDTALHPSPPTSAPPTPAMLGLASAALFGLLWLILINHLRVDWSLNPQYSYGWLVPFLALYLFWKRWPTRPRPKRLAHPGAVGALAAVLVLSLLPTRLVQESAPYWAAVSWTLALQVIGLSLAALFYMGGWPWLRHFAGPLCFFLVAVPWPSNLEIAITQGLMHRIAQLTAEILSWAGISAVPQGNLIRLSTGVLGVDEACSGVRSLQSMLMAALFLGELHLLSWAGRVALVFVGLGLALICNTLRTLVLALLANTQGLPALERWHDPAGFLILLVSFGGLCLAVRPLRRRVPQDSAPADTGHLRSLPIAWLLGIPIWIGITEVTTKAWYRAHETVTAGGWRVQPPGGLTDFQVVPISDRIRQILAYDEGTNVAWRGPAGSQWLLFFFKWHPTQSSRQSARFHRPEVCLPATGRTLVEERPRVEMQLGATRLAFRSYVFDDDGRPLHVFFSLREGAHGEIEAADMLADSRRARLNRVLEGRRDLGQQSLEVVVSGIDSAEEAEAAFREQMQSFIVPAGS